MLTPTKLVGFAAGAALAAMLVLAVPQDIATKPEPAGAEAGTASGATPISGEMTVLSQDEQGIRTDDEYGRLYTGEVWTSLFDVDDPRLTGKSRSRHNRHTLPGTPYGPRTMTMWLENEGGSWVGDGRAYQDPLTTALHYQILLEGRGGYEGLDAIIALDQPGFSLRFDVTGAIIPGGLPEAADPPPMELEVAEPS